MSAPLFDITLHPCFDILIVNSSTSNVTSKHEAVLSDITLHIFQDNYSVSSMNLENSQKNITSEDGTWWSINWYDNALSGLFSGSDKYEIRTNSPSIFNVRFYDNWAESWTDSII